MIAVASLIAMHFLSRARDVSAAASAGAAIAVDARQNECLRAWNPSWRQSQRGLGKIYQFTVEDVTGTIGTLSWTGAHCSIDSLSRTSDSARVIEGNFVEQAQAVPFAVTGACFEESAWASLQFQRCRS